MTTDAETFGLTVACLLGLFGSVHCLGMCGGISAAVGMALGRDASGRRRDVMLLLCHLGRILSYALIGATVALLAGFLDAYRAAMLSLRVLAGLMLILMGLYLAGLPTVLPRLEQAGAALWRPLQRLASRASKKPGPIQALLTGCAWGGLPCGLVYSTATWAGSSASWVQGGLLMFCFGLGTLPAVLGSGLAAGGIAGWLQRRALRATVGAAVIAFGVWTLILALLHGAAAGPHAQHH